MIGFKARFYYIWKKLAERQSRSHYRTHYKNEIIHFESYADKKPAGQMRREMAVLRKYWDCYPFQYIRYGMYQGSCELTIDEMKKYIPNFFAYYLFFPKIFGDYGFITEDKALTDAVLYAYNIPQPELLFKYRDGLILDRHNNPTDAEGFKMLLKNCHSKKVFIKPTFGLGGVGILIFHQNESGGYFNKSGEELTYDFLLNTLKSGAYVAQKGLVQHDEINKIYAHSINTFRIMTDTSGGLSRVMFAMLRMGQKGKEVDNASQAGLACKVDPETGKFANMAYTSLRHTMTSHPDTNFIFADYTFPYWDQVKGFITKVAAKFPEIRYLGWDVAFTKDGPAIIEINAGAGLEYLQDCHGGVRDAYGIRDPKKFWFHDKYILKDLK